MSDEVQVTVRVHAKKGSAECAISNGVVTFGCQSTSVFVGSRANARQWLADVAACLDEAEKQVLA